MVKKKEIFFFSNHSGPKATKIFNLLLKFKLALLIAVFYTIFFYFIRFQSEVMWIRSDASLPVYIIQKNPGNDRPNAVIKSHFTVDVGVRDGIIKFPAILLRETINRPSWRWTFAY